MKQVRKAKGAKVYVVAEDGVFEAKVVRVDEAGYVVRLDDGTFLETCTSEAWFAENRVFNFAADANKKARRLADLSC